jgi:soluble lytic murein transglycosylase-like protein
MNKTKYLYLAIAMVLVANVAIAGGKGSRSSKPTQNKYVTLVRNTAVKYKVEADFCEAITKIESDFQPGALNVNPEDPDSKIIIISPTRSSHGLMQITEQTGKAFNKNIKNKEDCYDPIKNVTAGVKYIRYLFKTYPEAPIEQIAELYNTGEPAYFDRDIRNPEYVAKFLRAYKDVKSKYSRESGKSVSH